MGCTVLVVDDHPEFRALARRLLESAGFHVVGESGDGLSALVDAERLRPDLVLLDIQLPDLDGFSVAERLAATVDGAPDVLLVSTRAASAYRRRLHTTPARGFLSKPDLTVPELRKLLDDRAGPGPG